MRELMHGSKQHIKLHKIKVIQVQQYEGLFVRNILKLAKTKVDIDEYLPEFEYNKEPNRPWLWNLVNSLVSDDFQNYIDEKVKLIEQQNLRMTINPEFVNIFKSSNAISSEKGMNHYLTRLPKKSSYQQKYEDIFEENKELETKTREQHDTIRFLNDKIWDFEEIEKKHDD